MFLLKAKLESFKVLTTKTNIVFSTKDEIDKLDILQLDGSEGYLAFNPDEYRTKVLEIIKNKRIGVSEDEMTPSQRLRNVLFLVHAQDDKGETFEEFYTKVMEKIIQHYKDKYL